MKGIKAFLYKYRHMWVLSYAFIYIPWFCYLEKTVTRNYHVMHVALDDFIPFNEYFIVPYMMWFLYVAGAILYFLLTSKEDFYRICTFLFSGMTIDVYKRQIFGCKACMGFPAVPAHPYNLHIPLLKPGISTCKRTGLPGAPGRIILRIKIQHHLLTSK